MQERKRYGEVDHGIKPDICCCASSIPRGLAMIPACSVGLLDGAPALLLYHPGEYRLVLPQAGSDMPLTLKVEGDFPESGELTVSVRVKEPTKFPLKLRVPAWCHRFEASVDEQTFHGSAGQWLVLDREWQEGDAVRLRMDLPVFLESQSGKNVAHTALRRGPLVMAVDHALDGRDSVPTNWVGLPMHRIAGIKDGKKSVLHLVSFADAGQTGGEYDILFDGVTLSDHATDRAALLDYRADLAAFRAEYGGAREMPDVPFFQFGMGPRAKLLFKDGVLRSAPDGKEVRRWDAKENLIVPPEYAVVMTLADGQRVRIVEDESAVWIEEDGRRTALPNTQAKIQLPDFAGHRYASILRVLHHEILINVFNGLPVPNFYVYKKPWYRDSAMMALCLQKTANLAVIEDWILRLREPYDHNNNGESEADNLGQGLFLVSLVSDKHHPLVPTILKEFPKFEIRDGPSLYLKGRSDFSEHPVYQTKWAKFGLHALGLLDPYAIPALADSYSSLFWMDYRHQHVNGAEATNRGMYPYLGWATDHFQGRKLSPISNRDYPLTWEINASQADYPGMAVIDPVFVKQKTAGPHTWHASEVFLYLLDQAPPSR